MPVNTVNANKILATIWTLIGLALVLLVRNQIPFSNLIFASVTRNPSTARNQVITPFQVALVMLDMGRPHDFSTHGTNVFGAL
jgi:hypothetical protein